MIELLPAEMNKDSNTSSYKYFIYIIEISMLIVLVVGSFYLFNLLKNLRLEKKRLNYKLQDLKERTEKLQQRVERINQYKKLYNINSKVSYARIIRDLNLIIPTEVWLTRFTLNNSKKIKLKGKTYSNQKLIITLNNLDKYPYFKEPKLISSDRKEDELVFQVAGRIEYEEE